MTSLIDVPVIALKGGAELERITSDRVTPKRNFCSKGKNFVGGKKEKKESEEREIRIDEAFRDIAEVRRGKR